MGRAKAEQQRAKLAKQQEQERARQQEQQQRQQQQEQRHREEQSRQHQQAVRAENDRQARYNMRYDYQQENYASFVNTFMENPRYNHTGFREVRGWGGYEGGQREVFTSTRGNEFYITGGGNRAYI